MDVTYSIFTPNMETVGSSQILTIFYPTTRRHIQEEVFRIYVVSLRYGRLHIDCRPLLKRISLLVYLVSVIRIM